MFYRIDIKKLEFLFSIILLILTGFFYTANFSSIFDITFADETYYLRNGLNIEKNGLPGSSQAPLYSLWYYFLSTFESNPINLYYLNYKLMVFLPSFCLYLFLRLAKVNNYISIIFSTLILIVTYRIWPFVSLFALIFIILGISFSFVLKNKAILFCVFSTFLLITSYIRPEFFISFMIAFLISLFLVFFKDKSKHRIKLFFSFFYFAQLLVFYFYLLETH